MPRGFTFAIKEFNCSLGSALSISEIEYRQVDSNPLFWRYLITNFAIEYEPHLNCFFSETPSDAKPYEMMVNAMTMIQSSSEWSELLFSLEGVRPLNRKYLDSSGEMMQFIEQNRSSGFYLRFAEYLDEKFDFRNCTVISIGADNQSGLLFGVALASYIKREYNGIHVSLGKHHYENFSLLHTIDKVIEQKYLFKYFDSVILYQELQYESVLGILDFVRFNARDSLKNLVIRINDDIEVIEMMNYVRQETILSERVYNQLSKYISDLGINPSVIHFNFGLINNQCYYSKCVFCVQIHKHKEKRFYSEPIALDLSMEIIEFLRGIGVTYFSFIDEALRERDLELLLIRLKEKSLHIIWNMRLISDVKIDRNLIERLKTFGCREVLIGLETVDQENALAMGKVSHKSSNEALTAMIYNFTRNDIHIILSMIYNFPTSKPDEISQLLRFSKRLISHNNKVQFIFNQFSLFGNTEIYKNHGNYNIKSVIENPITEDLKNNYHYIDNYGRGESDWQNSLRFTLLRLGVTVTKFQDSEIRDTIVLLEQYNYFDYASFGFLYRQEYKKGLYQVLKEYHDK
jgi:hypothetical protein